MHNHNSLKISSRIHQISLMEGLELLVAQTALEDAALITGSMLGGEVFDDSHRNSEVPGLTASLLDEGTKKHSKRHLREELESIGANMRFSSDNYRLRFSAACLKRDIGTLARILAEQLREPAFKQLELDAEKARSIAGLEMARENTNLRAKINFLQKIYPPGHPNYVHEVSEQIRMTEGIERADVVRFHRRAYGLGSMKIVAAGDVDEVALTDALRQGFGGWHHSDLAIAMPARPAIEPQTRDDDHFERVRIDDKTSADVFVGAGVGMDEQQADYYPLMLGMHAFGGAPLLSRLFVNVREKKGLTYRIGSGLEGALDRADGYWWINASFAPELLAQGMAAITAELRSFASKGITVKELEIFRRQIEGSHKVALSSSAGLSRVLLANAEQGRAPSWIDQFVPMITAIERRDVNAAISRHINPDKVVRVAAGSV